MILGVLAYVIFFHSGNLTPCLGKKKTMGVPKSTEIYLKKILPILSTKCIVLDIKIHVNLCKVNKMSLSYFISKVKAIICWDKTSSFRQISSI